MKELVKNDIRIYALKWTLKFGQSYKFLGNACSNGADRDICAICLEEIGEITSGNTNNPLFSIALNCNHAFHRGCLNECKICPLCRTSL